MDMQRQEYPALLVSEPQYLPAIHSPCAHPLNAWQGSLQPAEAVTVLNDRVRLIGKINTDIADWLQVAQFPYPASIGMCTHP